MLDLLNARDWYREFKYDHQRKQRGWSDRDTWYAGRYLLEVASGMLKKLGDAKSHIDWDQYFKTNYPHNRGYESLEQVAADIDHYLEFEDDDWVDTLGFAIKHGTKELPNGNHELVNLNTDDENRRIRKAIRLSHEEEKRRYEKAKNAMIFVATNFPALWD